MKLPFLRLALLGLLTAWFVTATAHAQRRPYLGYAYPAGGQVGTTFQLRLGGQDLDNLTSAVVTGSGVSVKIVEYRRRLNNQEFQLLNEQLKDLKRAPSAPDHAMMAPAMSATTPEKMSGSSPAPKAPPPSASAPDPALVARLEKRIREWVQIPACASIANLVQLEVTIAPEAELGRRELRLVTSRGISNALVFQVGQHTEYVRQPMTTATIQILGKEASALRKRPAAEAENRVFLPCTTNGQIASGEVNRYRFTANKGQRIVLALQARQLIPYIADAVPGWFQPVLVLYDSHGKEVAYADDYRFKPDPVICYHVPADGDYVAAIYDSIYRGREDFVYRLTLGELPFVTSIFPLGGQIGTALAPDLMGWNLQPGDLAALPSSTSPGVQSLVAHRMGYAANALPFVLDNLPNIVEREPNHSIAQAQPVTLPVAINGRIDRTDDVDVFQFVGRANQTVVAEVQARRLDSPLDSNLCLTDASGKVIAFNDDREDLTAGTNTHPADSSLTTKLPADGTYYVHLRDTARQGGEEYGYRLRLSAPQPDFELRVVPSSTSLALNSTTTLTVYAVRHDGFTGPIKLALKNPPAGLSAAPVTVPANQNIARLTLKSGALTTSAPVNLTITGSIASGSREITHDAVPTEDRMQAFLWRHLVPAADLPVLVYNPNDLVPPARLVPTRTTPAAATPSAITASNTSTAALPPVPAKPKFTKQQIVGRLRELKRLYEEGLLTDTFYLEKVAECDASAS